MTGEREEAEFQFSLEEEGFEMLETDVFMTEVYNG
ncbi:hypothetical protein ATL39_2461 [Sinobaca qinghaiensis]|uniref:Uncharacterized protein n=1 Tax=Sinobaca qinghaiensis TaxID=342944 RepID=A0A419UZJ5_9BACL|nr:hypothetical protein ATL39_2461 [Sinobaca qinghaiensis]